MFNTKSLASLSVTPDPLANDILVNVQLNENSYVVMKVKDEKGNLLLKEGQKAEFGANTYTLEGTHNLHPGSLYPGSNHQQQRKNDYETFQRIVFQELIR